MIAKPSPGNTGPKLGRGLARWRSTIAASAMIAAAAGSLLACQPDGPAGPTARPSNSASGPSPQAAVMYDCKRQSVSEPASFVLTCGDGTTSLDHLAWTDWGKPSAHATGQLAEVTCDPSCATGKQTQYPASVTATGLTNGYYTAMHISAPQAPNGSLDVSLDREGPTVK